VGFGLSEGIDMGYGWGRGQGKGRGRGRGGYGGYGGYGMGYGPGYGPGFQQPGMGQYTSIPPPPPGALRVAASVDENAGINSRISTRFARSMYMAIIDISAGKVVNVNIVPNPAANAMGGAGMMVAQWLVSCGVRVVIGSSYGPNAGGALAQAGITTHTVQPGTPVIEALRQLGLVKE